jgi:hypothetical protein
MNPPPKKPLKRLLGKPRKRFPMWPGWNKKQPEKDTMDSKTTRDSSRMMLGVALAPRETTQSTTGDA